MKSTICLPLQSATVAPATPPALPKHIAVIMDGNGRWAQQRGLPRLAGHRAGVAALKRTVQAAVKLGIPHLTVYAFSTENWERPLLEVSGIINLLAELLPAYGQELLDKGVRVRLIGSKDRLPLELQKQIAELEAKTRCNNRMNLTIAFSYGGRDEITKAVQVLAQQVADGTLKPVEITADMLGAVLSTHDLPDPDLFIRTSGEQRISNFLLWQIAYTELVFLDTLWPDFSEKDLEEAITMYNKRIRRYGKL